MNQLSKKDKEQLDESLVVLFLMMLSYKKDKEFKKLMGLYKYNRDMLKDSIGKIYLKYIKDNKLTISSSGVNKELKKLEPVLTKIGNDLKKQEDILIGYLLYKVYKDSYYKSMDIISKYKKIVGSDISDKTIIDSINKKINGKTIYVRNKGNKEKFITKVKKDIKKGLIAGNSIEILNKTIDTDFNSSISNSDRLMDNEVSRIFNIALVGLYKDMHIDKLEYNSTLDINSCEDCISSHGDIFNRDDAIDLPRHIKCNCFYTPAI